MIPTLGGRWQRTHLAKEQPTMRSNAGRNASTLTEYFLYEEDTRAAIPASREESTESQRLTTSDTMKLNTTTAPRLTQQAQSSWTLYPPLYYWHNQTRRSWKIHCFPFDRHSHAAIGNGWTTAKVIVKLKQHFSNNSGTYRKYTLLEYSRRKYTLKKDRPIHSQK